MTNFQTEAQMSFPKLGSIVGRVSSQKGISASAKSAHHQQWQLESSAENSTSSACLNWYEDGKWSIWRCISIVTLGIFHGHVWFTRRYYLDLCCLLRATQAAALAWMRYLERSKSFLVDLMQGQLRSCLCCLRCGHRSRTWIEKTLESWRCLMLASACFFMISFFWGAGGDGTWGDT